MKKPKLQDDALVADIAAAREERDKLHLWWLGQSGFLCQYNEKNILFDPYLSDSLTEKYEGTGKPHVRMTELAVKPQRIADVNVVTSSHNHTDHLDAATLLPLRQYNPLMQLIIPEANREFVAKRLHCDPDWPIGMKDAQSLSVMGINISAVPAAHENIDRDKYGHCHYLGYVVKMGPYTLYHSGDTVLYEGMADLLREFEIDIAMLPINGRDPARQVDGNMNGKEAAHLANSIGAKLVIPCHYDMFEFNTESPELFARTCESLVQPYRVLQCGERLTV